MYVGKFTALASVLTFVTVTSAFAQGPTTTGRPSTQERDKYLAVFIGAVAGSSTEPVFAVEFAEELHPRVEAYLTFSYLENVMTRTLSDELDATATKLSAVTGDAWTFRGSDQGLALAGGAKYRLGSGAIRPYVGGGAGVIRLERHITEARIGDVTLAVFNDFNLGDGDLSLAPGGLTRPLAEALIGVGFAAGSTYVDIGYRYRTVFRLTNGLEFSQVTVGVGYRF